MQKIKLQLQVSLKNDMIIGCERALESYYIIFKFLDFDETFETSVPTNRYNSFCSINGFRIRSVWDEPFGAIKDDGLIFPKLDKVGFEMKKVFTNDKDRHDYLKNLYEALNEWANNWYGFKKEEYSVISMKDDIWTITSKEIESNLYVSHINKNKIINNICY